MKVLSLRQPWASMVVLGIKEWETRGWKPGPRNLRAIWRDGLLIHASLSKKDSHLMGTWPFSNYLSLVGTLPYGAIIGRVQLGEIIPTEKWMLVNGNFKVTDSVAPPQKYTKLRQEYAMGDYNNGRFAWKLINPEAFKDPIPYSGALSIWDHPKKKDYWQDFTLYSPL